MNCSNSKRLCDKLIISDSVTFTDNTLIINIPDGTYTNCCKYCLVVAQTIPTTTTIAAPVVVTIGTGTTQYPLVNCAGAAVLACSINTRTRYSTVVNTNSTSGVFKLIGKIPCSRCENNLASLPISETTTG